MKSYTMLKESLRYLFLLFVVICLIPLMVFGFLFFWAWELWNPKASKAFWDDVNDPYQM